MTTESTAAPAAAAPAQASAAAPAAAPVAAPAAAPVAAPGAAPAAPAPNPAPAPGPAADGKGPNGEAITPGVPEVYDLKAPEGMELEPTAVAEFSVLAKDLKLSNEQAQKLTSVATAMQQRQMDQHATAVKGWEDQSKVDKEFGGDTFGENLATARKAIETFGTPELKALLDTSGLGNHPEVIRAFYRAGKQISEGKFVASGGRTPVATSEADLGKKLYPNMN